jgi:hypothetical protein
MVTAHRRIDAAIRLGEGRLPVERPTARVQKGNGKELHAARTPLDLPDAAEDQLSRHAFQVGGGNRWQAPAMRYCT